MSGTNTPALYYALRDGADASPDPVTGKNTEISTAWRIDAIQAFIVESSQAVADNALISSGPEKPKQQTIVATP